MHTDGTKVQPAFDEFVEHMATEQKGKGIITWEAVHGGEGPQYPKGSEPGPVQSADLRAPSISCPSTKSKKWPSPLKTRVPTGI